MTKADEAERRRGQVRVINERNKRAHRVCDQRKGLSRQEGPRAHLFEAEVEVEDALCAARRRAKQEALAVKDVGD